MTEVSAAETPFKSGFVALLGRPNAGKSTLINALLGRKLSIISAKPQTTRHKVLGLLNGKGFQACLLDTPGWLDKAKDALQGALLLSARIAARDDADVLVLVAEPHLPPPAELESLRRLLPPGKPLLLALNKIDLFTDPALLESVKAAYAAALSPVGIHAISALMMQGVAELQAAIVGLLPPSPAYYGAESLSDRWERFFACELVREAAFGLYREEVPHACAVEIDEFKDAPGRSTIRAIVYVETPGQKGIVIGPGGRTVRELTERSRQAIAGFLGRKVELELKVKVRSGWRKDPSALKAFGYSP